MSGFVGRQDELAALGEITGAAAAGQVAAAVVVVEPGSGKSRLLTEAAGQAPLSNRFRVVATGPGAECPSPPAPILRSGSAPRPPRTGWGRCSFPAPTQTRRRLRLFASSM